ncbi:hypothetical protein AAVH_33586, partial [Aphelenchoides avenae]
LTHIFFLYFTIAAISVPMVYRYLAVCRNRHMSNSELTFLVSMTALLSSPVAVCYYLSVGEASALTQKFHSDLIESVQCSDPGEIYVCTLNEVVSSSPVACGNVGFVVLFRLRRRHARLDGRCGDGRLCGGGPLRFAREKSECESAPSKWPAHGPAEAAEPRFAVA